MLLTVSTRSAPSTHGGVSPKLDSIGEVDQPRITPLVERLVSSKHLTGEHGVSYVLRTGRTTLLLFDSGLTLHGKSRSPLVRNAVRNRRLASCLVH
jgi:hypothetical protein